MWTWQKDLGRQNVAWVSRLALVASRRFSRPGADQRFMFGLFLKALIGAILWALANVVYYDLKRKGIRGFGRFAAFWVGNPTTWITFFCVPEGRRPSFAAPLDDDQALLTEIRRDRALRVAARGTGEDRHSADAPPED